MTTRVVHRPARVVQPVIGEDPLVMQPPPALPDGKTASGIQSMIPLAGAGVAMSMMMFLRGSGFAVFGAVIMVASLGAAVVFYFTQRGQATRKRRTQRERYLDYLEQLREDLRDHERKVQERAVRVDPPASHLLDVIKDPARLWERRRMNVDFLRIRLGVGSLPLREIHLREEGTPANPTDPFMLHEAHSLIRRFSRTPELPMNVSLDRAGDVSIIGANRADVLAVARAIIIQTAAFHAPDDVTLVVLAPPQRERDWAWVRWLPHLLDRKHVGPAGARPLLVTNPRSLPAILGDDLAQRTTDAAKSYRHGSGREEARTRARLLVIDDAYGQVACTLPISDQTTGLPGLGITVVHLLADRLHEPSEISSRVTVIGKAITIEDLAAKPPVTIHGNADDTPTPLMEGLARQLAPLRLSPDSYDDGTGTPPADFTTLLNLSNPTQLDFTRLWQPRSERDFLRVPLGVDASGQAIQLDLKESAQLGMGPHGLCVGATGSGKSELLRTLVLALVTTHPPDQLTMVLVDYKGGLTFAPFAELPHVAGLITNLETNASLVERMYTSLEGELLRRQQVLAEAGNITDIATYNMLGTERGKPTDMPPLSHLLVIIDEFGELLTAKPEFVELFLRIGRIGRANGVYLLLSSQRVEQGKLRGLENYLSYRIGLRTLSEMESRTVLDTPDAFHLPSQPGNGYLKVDVTVYEKFKAAYVSGPLTDDSENEAAPIVGPLVKPMPRYSLPVPTSASNSEELARPTQRTTGPTLLSVVLDQITAVGDHVQPIWLPPLPAAVTLDKASGGFDVTPRGVRLRVAQEPGPGLRVPIGLLDDPARQRQGPWVINLSAGGGHLLVLGGPSTGKTTALRTLALGLATTHTPTDIGIYGIDLLGSGLRTLAGLPHVGGVASRDDRERIRRTIEEVHGMLAERERLFAHHQLDTITDLRAERAAGRLDALPCTELVFLVDGYGQLFAEFESLERKVHDLLTRGGRYGIHIIATAQRWNEVRAAQQVTFANRIELRMTEPAESSIDGKLARAVPPNQPGRALTTEKLYAQVALPRLDAQPDPTTSGLSEAATLVRNAWTGPLPPPVRVLPAVLSTDDLADAATAPGTIPFGRFENDFAPAVLDIFGRDQHLVALGDSRTGKTNLLRLLAHSLIRQYSPDELTFAIFDPRRGLADVVPDAYSGGYAPNPTLAQQLTAAVCEALSQRSPGRPGPRHSDAKPHRIVLLIDDYDVLAASTTQPLGPFARYIAAGRDIGLHVLMTRRVAGASRGLHEPFTLAVRESGCLSLLMSGDRTEGQLFPGVRPTTLPPGRAYHIEPGEPTRIVQTAYFDPAINPTKAHELEQP